MGGDRGCREQQPEATGRAERAEVGDRALHDHGIAARQAAAIGVLGQRRCRPSRETEALPPLGDGQVGVPVLLQPAPYLVDELVRCGVVRRGRIALLGVGHGPSSKRRSAWRIRHSFADGSDQAEIGDEMSPTKLDSYRYS